MTGWEESGALASTPEPESRGPRAPQSGRSLRGPGVVLAFALAFLMLVSANVAGPFSPSPHAAAPASAPGARTVVSAGMAAPVLAAPTAPSNGAPSATPPGFNLPCFPLNATLCISLGSASVPNIIPVGTNHTASYMPNATDNITLYLWSTRDLCWPGCQTSGPRSPISLNVTGILWDGDPYMCTCDRSVWHSNGNVWWTAPPALQHTNKTYPFVYQVVILPRSGTGQPQFFSGETVFWYLYITSYDAVRAVYHGNQTGPTFQFRYNGAWAFSPHPGAVQYAGPSASTGDLLVHQTPAFPNWNDTITVSIRASAATVTNKSQIGVAATDVPPVVMLNEWAPNGSLVIANRSFPFPLPGGVPSSYQLNVTLPSYLTQVAGSRIVYHVIAEDSARYETNVITLPDQTVIVNGNGSLQTGVFEDDLQVQWSPVPVAIQGSATPTVIGPGVNVTFTVSTRSLSTSIQSAEALYTFFYAPLGETTRNVVAMHRLNSTTFQGRIPAMPLGATINITFLVLDYGHHLDTSPTFTYSAQTLSAWTVAVPQNETFFFIYVYNTTSQSYLSGAVVQVREVTAAGFNTVGTSLFGVAYPNATGNTFLPLLLAANQSYNISVTPNPASSVVSAGHTVTVTLFADPMSVMLGEHRTLARGTDYIVLLEGNSVYFWLGGTTNPLVHAANQGLGSPLIWAGVVGVVAAAPVALLLFGWFREIQARRKAEEKRVTL